MTETTSRDPASKPPRLRLATPAEATGLPEGARPVPGSHDWAYIPGASVWHHKGRWTQQLAWCPVVVDAVRYPSQDGATITRSLKISVAGQTEVVSAGDLARGVAWPKYATAAGFTGRAVSEALINIVFDQASQLPDIIGYPYFYDGFLRLPPTGYLPDGYRNGEGSTLSALTALVAGVASYPVAALLMGLAAAAPWVGALKLQPFTIHIVGDTTTGKTTAVTAASALYGRGYKGVTRIWSGTTIGAQGAFRDLGVLPVFRDELGTMKATPAERANMFSTIMEGCHRTARTRDDLPRPSASWASVCFSTGNISAVPPSHISAGTPKGVIELHADGNRPVIPAGRKLHVQTLTNDPAVEGAWIPHATQIPLDQMREEVQRAGRDLGHPAADGLQWHMWRAMSLALAGARVLAAVTSTPQLATSAEIAARQVIADADTRMAEMGADHGARLIDTVTEIFAAHPSAFGQGFTSGNIEQTGFTVKTQDGTELVCIYPNKHVDIVRRAEVEDAMTALRQLRESGQLHTTKGLKYRARRGEHLIYVYAYNLAHDLNSGAEKAVFPPVPPPVPPSHSQGGTENEPLTCTVPPVPPVPPENGAGTCTETGNYSTPPEETSPIGQAPEPEPDPFGGWPPGTEGATRYQPDPTPPDPAPQTATTQRTPPMTATPAPAPAPAGKTPPRSTTGPRTEFRTRPPFSDPTRGPARITILETACTALDATPAGQTTTEYGTYARQLGLADALVTKTGKEPPRSGPFAPWRGSEPPLWRHPQASPARLLIDKPDRTTIIDSYAYHRDYSGPVTVLDRNAAQIAALTSIRVARGALTQTGPLDDAGQYPAPGYYKVHVYPWAETLMPSPLGTAAVETSTWIPAPTMGLLRELATAGRWPDPGALDSLTGEPCSLNDWAQLLAAVRAYALTVYGRGTDPFTVAKIAFSQAKSMMLGAPDPAATVQRRTWKHYNARADWAHAQIAQAAATMWRTADRCARLTGPELAPVAMRNVDELVIPAAALGTVTTATLPGATRPPVSIDPATLQLGTFKIQGQEKWQ